MEQLQKTTMLLGRIFVTDNKYRLMACLDDRADLWRNKGPHTVWHLALENSDPRLNYGIYANGGLLVETCCLLTLQHKSNMELLDAN